jgi:isopenicillin-N epimerase
MLNHGSFGACPRAVLQRQQRLRAEMEREPVRFFTRQMQPLLDDSRRALAELIGADPADVVFGRNATTAVNSVLRSLGFEPGDELLVTDHDYNACRNAVRFVAERAGARVVVAPLPLPIESAGQVVEAIVARVTDRTRLALIDHVTSPTAVIFPIEAIVRQLDQRGVDTLVDGAHAPGMIPLELARIGAAYYAGNCHKWLCAPKGAAFLHVRPDRQEGLQPAVISHGFNTPRAGYSRFQDTFDWTGSDDPTPWLCVGEAIRFLDALSDGGIRALMGRNHELVLAGRQILREALDLAPTCPEAMIGSMAALKLPDDAEPAPAADSSTTPTVTHRLQSDLLERFGVEVPVYHWPGPPQKLLRISAHAYNHLAQYEQLAAALAQLLSPRL